MTFPATTHFPIPSLMKHIPNPSRILAVLSVLALSAASALAAPTIEVKEGTTTLVSGTSSVAFPTTAVGSSSIATTFTVKNTGTTGVDLTLSVATATGNAADFVVSTPGSTSLGYGVSTTFTVTFSPTSNGARATVLRITNNDSGSSPFNIDLTGTGQAPEIAVEDDASANIADGGSKSFGSVNVATGAPLTFTIKNTGNVNLTGLTITKDGTNAIY